MTVSIGISTYRFPDGGSLEELVEASDRALYRAKQRGRDRVEYMALQAAERGFVTAGMIGRIDMQERNVENGVGGV